MKSLFFPFYKATKGLSDKNKILSSYGKMRLFSY